MRPFRASSQLITCRMNSMGFSYFLAGFRRRLGLASNHGLSVAITKMAFARVPSWVRANSVARLSRARYFPLPTVALRVIGFSASAVSFAFVMVWDHTPIIGVHKTNLEK